MKKTLWLLLITALLITACAGPRETYVILPDSDGQAGKLTVTPKTGQALELQGAYAAAQASSGSANRRALDEKATKEMFAEALSARPPQPLRFTLYFLEGSDELTADSKRKVEEIFAAVRQRPAPDVVVVGHTDRVGSIADNDRLALRRAEKIRADFLRQGLTGENVQAAGRGEREPLVATADEVAEPKNRRVEILVR